MINSIKELEQLLKLCRKQGVLKIKCHGVEVELGDIPVKNNSQSLESVDDPYHGFPEGELTPEQLAFYSAGGQPSDDPFLKKEAS